MLGFKSWTDYVADVVGKDMTKLPVDDRRQIVELLAGEGMSQRQIAAAVGVSQKTVDRDLDQVSHNDSPDDQVITEPKPITGRDGKTYRPKPPQPQQESKQRRWPITEEFRALSLKLAPVGRRIDRLSADDRILRYRGKLNVNRNELIRFRDALNGLIDQLDGDR